MRRAKELEARKVMIEIGSHTESCAESLDWAIFRANLTPYWDVPPMEKPEFRARNSRWQANLPAAPYVRRSTKYRNPVRADQLPGPCITIYRRPN